VSAEAPAPAAAAAPPVAPVDPAAAPASATGGGAPDLDTVKAVWEDALLPKLVPAAKARYRGGRFASIDAGTAVFALPNDMHRQRCEEFRADVEDLLTQHFGAPLSVKLVVDADVVEAGLAEAASAGGSNGAEPVPPATAELEDEEAIDPTLLVDAVGEDQSAVEQLAEAFGAVEVIEEDS
jgi:hypothetical protein